MSESRFDFLRELVKNVPDINVDELQASTDDQTATDLSMPYKKSTATTSSCESPVSSSSKSIKSIPPFNGNSLPSNTSIQNGNKRSHPTIATATATSVKSKPQTLLKTQSMDQSLYTNMSTSYQTPNFYTEISDELSVIQYTPKIKNDSNLDVRPPKLARIDSAPAGLSNVRSSAYTSHLTVPNTPPVMTFDFSKTALPPPPMYPNINMKPPIPPLTPIVINQPTTSLHSSFLYSSMSTLTPPTITTGPNTTPFVKFDVSPLTKTIDCTNLDVTSQLPSTSKPMNIDLSNSFNIAQPIFGSISSSNNLEMDEDYDNI